MKQLMVIGKASEDANAAFSYLGNFFGIQRMEQGIDVAKGLIGAMRPDMVIVGVTELLDSPPNSLADLQKDNPGIPVATFGAEADFSRFQKLYTGGDIQNINIPFDEDATLYLVCSALKVSMNKLKAEFASKKTILVVDDDATTLRSFKSMLDKKYFVELANSGADAIAAIGKKLPDQMLLDYDMPGMNGKEVLEKVRANAASAKLPVIFVTGVTDKSIIAPLIPLRPSGYLLKPVTMYTLEAEVEKVIGK